MIKVIQTEIYKIAVDEWDYEDYRQAQGVENPTEKEVAIWLWEHGYEGAMDEITVEFEEA